MVSSNRVRSSTFDPRPYILQYYEGSKVNDGNRYPRLMAWEFIYDYVWAKSRKWEDLIHPDNLDTTALHLGFYLANWGMYRGSSALLNRSNLNLMKELSKLLMTGKGAELMNLSLDDFKSQDADCQAARNQALFNDVLKIFENKKLSGYSWTDTLVTKILLGVWGECPALDRYYLAGVRKYYPRRNLTNVSGSALTSLADLIEGEGLKFPSKRIATQTGNLLYPKGKLMDMAFFQAGFPQNS